MEIKRRTKKKGILDNYDKFNKRFQEKWSELGIRQFNNYIMYIIIYSNVIVISTLNSMYFFIILKMVES